MTRRCYEQHPEQHMERSGGVLCRVCEAELYSFEVADGVCGEGLEHKDLMENFDDFV